MKKTKEKIKIRFIRDIFRGDTDEKLYSKGEIIEVGKEEAKIYVDEEKDCEYVKENNDYDIPKQLEECRFCRIRKGTKKPFEQNWTNLLYAYEEIKEYFPKENYGVLTGINGLAVLDDDSKDKQLIELYEQNFPDTFRVREHYYFYLIDWNGEKIIFYDDEGNHIGELQGLGQQVVGAGSIHPSGEIYEVKKDLPIVKIKYDDFMNVFSKYVKSTSENDNVKIKQVELTEEDKNIISDIKKKWKEGDRQNLTLSLAGYLRKEKRIGVKRALNIIKQIC